MGRNRKLTGFTHFQSPTVLVFLNSFFFFTTLRISYETLNPES